MHLEKHIAPLKRKIADLISDTYSGTLNTDAKQDVNRIIEIFRDLVNELEACLELKKDLEKKVQLRTEQLELANKELETFSYSVSHDLKAPLRIIHGFSHMLLEDYQDKLDEKGMRMLNSIMKNSQKMRLLIDELLEFSQIGKQELSKTVIEMDKLVEEVVQEVSQTYPHKANLVIQPLGQAVGDFNLLKLIYQNLLLNAIKYSSKKESPEIEIGVLENTKAKTYYVKDNGAGFDMEYYDKLFAVFQRLHNQSEFEGVGIGLAIVHRIITKHGGKVWAEGQPRKGATFYFTLENENI